MDLQRVLKRSKEIAGDAFASLRARPRLTFLAACLVVLLVSWWSTVHFADQLLSSLPEHKSLDAPQPMSEADIEKQIEDAKRANDALRAQRESRAYAYDATRGVGADSGRFIDDEPLTGAPTEAHAAEREPDPRAYVATDAPAEPVYTVEPTLPDLARQSGTVGTVVVQALVGTDGRVRDTRILKSIPELNGAAQDAVRRWRFKPAMAGGMPVATWVSVPMTFRR